MNSPNRIISLGFLEPSVILKRALIIDARFEPLLILCIWIEKLVKAPYAEWSG